MLENLLVCLVYLLKFSKQSLSKLLSSKWLNRSFLTGTLRIHCYVRNRSQVSFRFKFCN